MRGPSGPLFGGGKVLFHVGKILMIMGGILFVIGLILSFSGRIPLIGKLPGDIVIKRDNFVFYFPITTSILLSIVLTLVFYLISRLMR